MSKKITNKSVTKSTHGALDQVWVRSLKNDIKDAKDFEAGTKSAKDKLKEAAMVMEALKEFDAMQVSNEKQDTKAVVDNTVVVDDTAVVGKMAYVQRAGWMRVVRSGIHKSTEREDGSIKRISEPQLKTVCDVDERLHTR